MDAVLSQRSLEMAAKNPSLFLDDFAEAIAQLSKLVVDVSPAEIYPDLLSFWNRSRSAVSKLVGTNLEDATYAEVGKLHALMAHTSSDTHDRRAAALHLRHAQAMALRSRDAILKIYVAWIDSNVHYWDGHYDLAIRALVAAEDWARQPPTQLRLACQQGRILSKGGLQPDTRLAIDRAQSILNSTSDLENQGSGIFGFSRGKALYYLSEIQLEVDQFDDAREFANAALLELVRDPSRLNAPEFQAAARLDLVNAMLATSSLYEASSELKVLVTMRSEIVTVPIEERLRKSLGALESMLDPVADDLAVSVNSVLARPARKQALLPTQLRS